MLAVFTLRRFFTFAIFCSLSIQLCIAQQGVPPGAGSTGTGPGTAGPGGGNIGPRPGTNTPTQPQQTPTDPNRFPDIQRQIILLSGKVMLDDGTAPPEPVLIERICSGSVRPEGYTDSKGRFSFHLGQNSNMFMDASMSSANESDPFNTQPGRSTTSSSSRTGSSSINLTGCDLRAVLAGFRSDVVTLQGRRAMDNPDVGTIILHRMGKVDGFTFSGTSTYAPKDARKAYEKGREAAKKQKWPEAEQDFQKAVEIYPKYAVAWYELGMVNQVQKNIAEAKKAYLQSLTADSKYISPYGPLARIAISEKNWKDSAEYTDKLLKLNPYVSPDAYFFNAVAYYNLQNLDKAEEGAREALKMDTQHHNPKINQLLGIILAQKQDYPGAAENMRAYLKLVPDAPDAGNVKMQLTEVEKLLGAKADSKQTDPPAQ